MSNDRVPEIDFDHFDLDHLDQKLGSEQAIMDAVQERGYRVVIVTDNGFPEIYHPSEEKQTLCAMGKLLLLTPWKYHYRTAEVGITVAECKTMNCIAQAICRMKDSWWV